MTKFCQEHDIIHEVTARYTSQSNSVAERKNRTLMYIVNCMLLSPGAPENLGEALLSSCFILNRIFQIDSDITPYECWKGRNPNVQFFKVWGYPAKVSILELKKKKFYPKTIDAIFIGYVLDKNVNRFLVVNSNINEISNSAIIEAVHVVYFENIFSLKSRIPNDPSCTLRASNILSSNSAPTTDLNLEGVKEVLAQRPNTLFLMMINSHSYSTNDLVLFKF